MNHPTIPLSEFRGGVYVASRVNRAPMWREWRDADHVITSSWIDEAEEGQTADYAELWPRIVKEISSSRGLIFYAHTMDSPWKGALVEVGIALGLNKPVVVVVDGVLDGRTFRPVGSWLMHPLVRRCETVGGAFAYLRDRATWLR